MTGPDRLAEVYRIFALALDAPADDRRAFVEAHASGWAELAAEVLDLLDAHDASGSFLPASVSPDAAPPDEGVSGRAQVGDLVGVWRLVATIGEGGMGEVFRAERSDGVFEQQVAIKLTRFPLIDRDGSRRFRAERAILAGLNHPNVVKLLDGGTLAGQAWLAMELVEGEPITRFAHARALDLRARLRLFRDVCAAVHHAHQHGIVHRDLKPQNVLATADGVAKVVDFGVAKLLTPDASGDHTRTGAAPLTPNYASPEQLRGLPVTTATDVYALGVLLYEMVSGARPYETTGKPLDEVMAIVVDREPVRPSDAPGPTGPAGRAWPRRGDIDAIVLKAMAKAPERRHASAAELAGDIERYLEGRPVLAKEPSLWYVASRIVRRHAAASIAAAVALLAVVIGLGMSIWQARIADRERQRAEARLTDVRRLANTLLFTVHDAVEPLNGSTPVRQVIVKEALGYLERLASEPGDDPGVRIELAEAYTRIGRVQGDPQRPNLGDREGARRSFRRSLELVMPLTDDRDARIRSAALAAAAQTHMALTSVYTSLAQQEAALESARASVALAERGAAEAPADDAAKRRLGSAHFALALALQRRPESIEQWRRTGGVFEALLAARPDDPDRLRNVALVCKYLGGELDANRSEEAARAQFERALALDERRLALAPSDRGARLDVTNDLVSLAAGYTREKRSGEAHALLERALGMRREMADADPKDMLAAGKVGSVEWRLAENHVRGGRPNEALPWAERAVATMGRVAEHQRDVVTLRDLAAAHAHLAMARDGLGSRAAACAAAQRAADVSAQISRMGANPFWPVLVEDLPSLVARCRAR